MEPKIILTVVKLSFLILLTKKKKLEEVQKRFDKNFSMYSIKRIKSKAFCHLFLTFGHKSKKRSMKTTIFCCNLKQSKMDSFMHSFD